MRLSNRFQEFVKWLRHVLGKHSDLSGVEVWASMVVESPVEGSEVYSPVDVQIRWDGHMVQRTFHAEDVFEGHSTDMTKRFDLNAQPYATYGVLDHRAVGDHKLIVTATINALKEAGRKEYIVLYKVRLPFEVLPVPDVVLEWAKTTDVPITVMLVDWLPSAIHLKVEGLPNGVTGKFRLTDQYDTVVVGEEIDIPPWKRAKELILTLTCRTDAECLKSLPSLVVTTSIPSIKVDANGKQAEDTTEDTKQEVSFNLRVKRMEGAFSEPQTYYSEPGDYAGPDPNYWVSIDPSTPTGASAHSDATFHKGSAEVGMYEFCTGNGGVSFSADSKWGVVLTTLPCPPRAPDPSDIPGHRFTVVPLAMGENPTSREFSKSSSPRLYLSPDLWLAVIVAEEAPPALRYKLFIHDLLSGRTYEKDFGAVLPTPQMVWNPAKEQSMIRVTDKESDDLAIP